MICVAVLDVVSTDSAWRSCLPRRSRAIRPSASTSRRSTIVAEVSTVRIAIAMTAVETIDMIAAVIISSISVKPSSPRSPYLVTWLLCALMFPALSTATT